MWCFMVVLLLWWFVVILFAYVVVCFNVFCCFCFCLCFLFILVVEGNVLELNIVFGFIVWWDLWMLLGVNFVVSFGDFAFRVFGVVCVVGVIVVVFIVLWCVFCFFDGMCLFVVEVNLVCEFTTCSATFFKFNSLAIRFRNYWLLLFVVVWLNILINMCCNFFCFIECNFVCMSFRFLFVARFENYARVVFFVRLRFFFIFDVVLFLFVCEFLFLFIVIFEFGFELLFVEYVLLFWV